VALREQFLTLAQSEPERFVVVDADAVLDMIGVHPSRRIDYHSILTEGKHDLDSLILLDLPDHDSVEVKHSVLVDQALPLVDILIWVLDPQKYADHLIHESYLSATRASMGIARLAYASTLLAAICTGLLLGLSLNHVALPLLPGARVVPLWKDVLSAGLAACSFGLLFSMPLRALVWPICVGMAAHALNWLCKAEFGLSPGEAAGRGRPPARRSPLRPARRSTRPGSP